MDQKFNKVGAELPDSTPMEIPLGAEVPESLQQMFGRMLFQEVSQRADAAGMETFEEANDFDIPEGDPTLDETLYTLEEEHINDERERRAVIPGGDSGEADQPRSDKEVHDAVGAREHDSSGDGDGGKPDSEGAPRGAGDALQGVPPTGGRARGGGAKPAPKLKPKGA